jgi:hypothetical protein
MKSNDFFSNQKLCVEMVGWFHCAVPVSKQKREREREIEGGRICKPGLKRMVDILSLLIGRPWRQRRYVQTWVSQSAHVGGTLLQSSKSSVPRCLTSPRGLRRLAPTFSLSLFSLPLLTPLLLGSSGPGTLFQVLRRVAQVVGRVIHKVKLLADTSHTTLPSSFS